MFQTARRSTEELKFGMLRNNFIYNQLSNTQHFIKKALRRYFQL